MTPRPSGSTPRTAGTRRVDEHRAALARALGVGGVLVPAFGVIDLVLRSALYPEADLAVILALRVLGTAAAWLAWWIARSPRFSDRVARVAHAACLAVIAGAVAGLAAELGGITSVYVHGLTVIAMVRSSTVPEPAPASLFHNLVIVLVYPAVFALLYALDPAQHAAWTSRGELSLFLANYFFVWASAGAGTLSSRTAWMAQRQLFQARKLGRYRLEAPIGRGGQSEVWLARDASLRRNVALKVLRSDHASENAVRLFEREALLASQLASPHTVRIFDFGASDDGVHYLAMEHLDGADLGVLSRAHGPMPAARVVHFGVQLCRSLEEAHAKGLVHRDIKPSNLFALRLGAAPDHLKVLDFGVARSLDEAETQLTHTGVFRGTPAYVAPECFSGAPASVASDLYGVGACLYHLLSGAPPFSGTDAELVARHLGQRPAPLGGRVDPKVPADVEAVVLRCLEKRPDDRFPSAAALREALEACAAGEWTHADAARFWEHEREAALSRWEAETVA